MAGERGEWTCEPELVGFAEGLLGGAGVRIRCPEGVKQTPCAHLDGCPFLHPQPLEYFSVLCATSHAGFSVFDTQSSFLPGDRPSAWDPALLPNVVGNFLSF